ncbi:MAG: Smr/MutS family protein [Acidobacteriota bacterium]
MDEGEPGPVELPISDALDLHAFAPRDVLSVVEEYLREAHRAGLRVVRVIHGRGRGVQKARVQDFLARCPLVARAYEASAELGGWGATIVELADNAEDRDTPVA